MDFIKEIWNTPITWGSYITVAAASSAFMVIAFGAICAVSKIRNWIRLRKINVNEVSVK